MNEITKRRESYFFIILCCLFNFGFVNCRTVPRVIPDNGTGATATRENLDTITSGQTELAITGTEIKNTSEQINNGVGELERSIIGTEVTGSSFEEIIREVRKRPLD